MIVVNSISANVQCGGCGKSMVIDIDASTKIPEGWDLMDIVEDDVRGGLSAGSSVQGGLSLCKSCTTLVDSIGDEDYLPTETEIFDKLNNTTRRERS